LDGFKGLVENRVVHLGAKELSGLLTLGGTILGTSRDKPHKMPLEDGSYHNLTGAAIENYHKLGLDCLICLGGGGTQKNAHRLMKEGKLNIITLPKTIDNDVYGTDVTFGFDTGMTIACEAIDRLHTTASSHHRIMLVDIMGHNAGWLALGAGISGGADVILIPEVPYSLDKIFEALRERRRSGKRFSIVVVAEGAKALGTDITGKDLKQNSNIPAGFFPHKILGSNELADKVEKELGIETRVTTLGYLQRGGVPTPTDRLLATHLGARAGEAAVRGEFGVMIAVKNGDYVTVPLDKVAGKKKVIKMTDPMIKTANYLGISLGT